MMISLVKSVLVIMAVYIASTKTELPPDASISFDDHVISLIKNVTIPKEIIHEMSLICGNIEARLQYKWPGCKVITFGSVATGLLTHVSDIDCFLELPVEIKPSDNILQQVKDVLELHPTEFRELVSHYSYNVPLLRIFYVPLLIYFDITFSGKIAVRNSQLIGMLLNSNPAIYRFTVLLKYWNRLNNLFPNTLMYFLVIFYLQQIETLPSIRQLQKANDTIELIDHWNVYFDKGFKKTLKNASIPSLQDLVGGFLKFYNFFDFDHYIISVYLGHPIEKRAFYNESSLPSELYLYKWNVVNNLVERFPAKDPLCVQYPFSHNLNSGHKVIRKSMERNIMFLRKTLEKYKRTNRLCV